MVEPQVPETSSHRVDRWLTRRTFVSGGLASVVALAGSYALSPSAMAASAGVISRGSTSSATVALTFDCGSDVGYTGSILDTAAAYGVPLTFGVTGQYAASYPGMVARMVNEGHDIMNHSYDHASYTGTSSSYVLLSSWARQDDLEQTESALVSASGRGGRPLFRPPYGDYDSSVLSDVGAIGFTWCVMWSIDVLGWNGLSYDQVVNRALSNHGNGYIYLMHVGSQSQEGPALPQIIEGLRSRGYGFVTISGMTGSSPTSPPPSPPPPTTVGYAAGTTLQVTTSLRLRTSASTGAGIIATMPSGTIVTVVSGPTVAGGFTWYQVDTPYGRGWAAGEYMVVTSAPPPPPPPPTTTGYAAGTTLKVTAGLYLRTAAGLGSGVITTMPTGTVVTVVSGPSPSGGYTWYQVDSPYGRGWAAGEFMVVTTDSPSTPSPSEPPPPTSTGYAAGTTLKVTAGLYLRTAAGLGSGVITTMPTGTVVTVVSGPSPSGGYTWYQVDTPYGRGWAAGEFLVVTSDSPSPPPPSEPPPPSSGGWAAGTTVKVTAGLWLRTAGNLDGSVITTMPTGTVCTVVSGPAPSGGYTWYQLDTPYGRGWAAGEFLAPTSEAPSQPPPPSTGGYAPGTTLKVTAGLWLRTAGNLDGSVITTMPTGTIVTVVSGPAPSGGLTWYQVDTPYGRGWAAGEYLVPA